MKTKTFNFFLIILVLVYFHHSAHYFAHVYRLFHNFPNHLLYVAFNDIP